jgi:hypothetical protein
MVAQREALVFTDEHRRGSILAETSATNGELASIDADEEAQRQSQCVMEAGSGKQEAT